MNCVDAYCYPQVEAFFQYGGFKILRLSGHQSECQRLEKQLLDARIPIPLHHRVSWTQNQITSTSTFYISTEGAGGLCSCGFAVDESTSRALPGNVIWRVERFASAVDDESRAASLHGLAHYARGDPRVLRVHLQVFSRDRAVRHSVAHIARALGFINRAKPSMYTDTVVIDLRPSEEEIFASFHGTARRHVRAVEKNPVELRLIKDPRNSVRLTALVRETMERTGGRGERRDWPTIIEFSNRHPGLSRVIGLHRTDVDGPHALLAFAWGRFHGDHVDYAAAASTRETDLRMPFGYALAWDLMRWGKRQGATWFDFGGITTGRFGEGDLVGGVSDFKRYFGGEIVSVSEEWLLEPRPIKAKIANTVSAGAAWVRRLFASRS